MRGTCRNCGCDDDNCEGCVRRTGVPCHWVNDAHDLCSACVDKPFIVAEISKNWVDGQEVNPTGPVCHQFEEVINHNWERGYVLHQFTLATVILGPGSLNESLIAVFRKKEIPVAQEYRDAVRRAEDGGE